ncbi:asparagine synthase-related protein [Sphingomonas sp.]|uniref:asparagine synthetase B family protein n=1 Tax=Sphingomonas sp. TaxID=28214 RepID=UPI0017FF8329|nr:asparagine synthase-related protein [Sphingomonas sp.]MBA3512361.1 asparagine synthase [Sphingomonas sp.]
MLQGQAAYGSKRAQDENGSLALGRNLFALLPEDAFDQGPLSRANCRFVADVRLDNRPELAARLGIASATQARLSDSSLLFESLLRWGDSAIEHWVGEFAFAFWDGARQHLLLGRDILGLRPLYFHRGKDFFAFASMPSGLHALEDVPYDFDSEFMAERLALLPRAGRRSYFKGIERVEPAHLLRVTRQGLEAHGYWRPPGPSSSAARPEEYEQGLRAVVDQAVKAQLRGVGNTVATQLSGGLDSSMVTATVARLLPAGKVIAFTAVPRPGFAGRTPPGTVANEAELAAATARMYPNIDHVLVENSGESPLKWLDRIFLYQQQPGANLANAVWGQAISSAARSSGSNTIFKASFGNLTSSYSGLEWLPFLLSRGQLLKLAGCALQLARNGVPLLELGAQTVGPFVPAPLWQGLRRLTGRTAGPMDFSAVSRGALSQLQRKRKARSADLSGRPRDDPYGMRLRACADTDGGNAYKGVLAEWGLSVRDPTADKRVIEYCLATPVQEFVRGGVPRSLARRAFSDRLPPQVTESKVRGYQSADWYEALDRARPEVEREVEMIARCADANQALDIGWLKDALDSWPEHNWNRSEVSDRYRLGLLRGISAGHFMRKVRGTN